MTSEQKISNNFIIINGKQAQDEFERLINSEVYYDSCYGDNGHIDEGGYCMICEDCTLADVCSCSDDCSTLEWGVEPDFIKNKNQYENKLIFFCTVETVYTNYGELYKKNGRVWIPLDQPPPPPCNIICSDNIHSLMKVFNQYKIYRFFTTNSIICILEFRNTNPIENIPKCTSYDDDIVERMRYGFAVNNEVYAFVRKYEFDNSFANSYVLEFHDFTDEFKTTKLPVENQIKMMLDLNLEKFSKALDSKW